MTATLLVSLAVFGACSVEMVAELTIVMAAGFTRGWRAALDGAAVAVVCLATLAAFLGPPLIHYSVMRIPREGVSSRDGNWWRRSGR
jgi:uncharacterized membrane protein